MKNFSIDDSGMPGNKMPANNTPSLAHYPEYQIAMIIWVIWPPCIILLGSFGNIATIFVMRRIKDHNSSQHLILSALALSDLTLLYSATTQAWIKNILHVDLMVLHVAVCKVLMWVIYASGALSAWLVTCVTLQRTMAVLWPHRMRVMCTMRRTWIVIATLVITACVINFHIVIGMEVTQNVCLPMQGMYRMFLDYYFSWMDLCLAAFIPSVVLFICDIILSVTLFKAMASSSLATGGNSNAQNTDSRRKMSYRTIVMVLLISCAFLLLATPICAAMSWYPYGEDDINQYVELEAKWVLTDAVTHQLWYTNSAINFFFYCLTGTKFRREFMNWIRCGGARSPSAPSVHETASEASKAGRHKHHGNRPLSK